jgi:NAD(P)-dependent dehydrogenase (short-subunit alcohol dehydrogenase family)
MGLLTGKTAFISAAGSLVGQACASALFDCGARVCLADADRAAIRLPGDPRKSLAVDLDVQDEASWQTAFRSCQQELGSLDVVVLCDTGGRGSGRLVDTSLDAFRQILYGTGLVAWTGQKQAVIAMRQAGVGGAIVHVTSVLGVVAAPEAAAYCAGAAGTVMLARAGALECAKAADGIVINTVLSAPVNGEERGCLSTVPRVSPADVAAAVVFYATDGAAYMTGTELPVDRGFVCQ